MAVALLPNGEQQFIDGNGVPYVGGSVFFYIPSTSTPKNTWKDAGGTILNTNPVILDAAGRAIIYGDGQYRQVLQDSLGNTIWDQITQGGLPTDLSAFTAVASGATTERTLANYFADVVTPLDYGAIGNGTADDTAALTAAFASGKPVQLGPASLTYKITSQVPMPSNLWVMGQGALIDASSFSVKAGALAATGTLGTSSAITGTVNPNVFVLPVTDGTVFSVGAWVLLTTLTTYIPSNFLISKGEWLQIRSISGNNITVTTPVIDTYTTAGTGVVYNCNFVENILLDNVHIKGPNIANDLAGGIGFQYARYFEIRGGVSTGFDLYAYPINSCIWFTAHHTRSTGVYYDGVTGLDFYNFALLNSCQYFSIGDNIARTFRHHVVTDSNAAGQGFFGVPTSGIVHDNVMMDAETGAGRSFAYEMHGGARQMLWSDNIANGCYSFMRIENGSHNRVVGGGCDGYAVNGITIGAASCSVDDLLIEGVALNNYTGEVTSSGIGGGTCLYLAASAQMTNIAIVGVVGRNISVSNNGRAADVLASTTLYNIRFKSCDFWAGTTEDTSSFPFNVEATVSDVFFDGCSAYGWRRGYNFLGSKCYAQGGSIENYSAGATGFGAYTNGDRNIIKNVHFRNIDVVYRCDTASTNCLMTANTATDCTTTTPSDSGTGNTTSGNFVV